MNNILYYIVIIIAGLIGLSLSIYIGKKKRNGSQLVCPLGADCDAVIHSEYAKFFGIPLEVMGTLYYLVIVLGYLFFLIFPQIIDINLSFFLLTFSAIGFLFSIYLVFIQLFAIKQWCTWCLISAICSIFIFTISLLMSKMSFLPIIESYYGTVVTIYALGLIIGIAGASFTDLLFFKFLADFKLTMKENKILRFFSQIIWLGLAIIIISGIDLYLLNISTPLSDIFIARMIIMSIIIVNGGFLNLYLAPKLVSLSFVMDDKKISKDIVNTRKNAFTMAGISFVSWYSIFILSTFRGKILLSLSDLLAIYIFIIFLGVLITQIAGILIIKKK